MYNYVPVNDKSDKTLYTEVKLGSTTARPLPMTSDVPILSTTSVSKIMVDNKVW